MGRKAAPPESSQASTSQPRATGAQAPAPSGPDAERQRAGDPHPDAPSRRSHAPRPGRPRGPRRDRDERRAELLDAAERAIRRVGPSASMDEIAAEAGITKPILYTHFGDKAGMSRALAERVGGRLNRTVGEALSGSGEPRDIVASTIAAFCTFVESETELYRFLVQTSRSAEAGPRLTTDIGSQIAVNLGGALRRVGADSGAAEPWAYAIVGMTFGGAAWWLQRRTMSKDDLVEYLTQLLWSGLSGSGLGDIPTRGHAAGDADADRPDDDSRGADVTPFPRRPTA